MRIGLRWKQIQRFNCGREIFKGFRYFSAGQVKFPISSAKEKLREGVGDVLVVGGLGLYMFGYLDDYNVSINPSDWFPVTRIDKKTLHEEIFERFRNDSSITQILNQGNTIPSYSTYGSGGSSSIRTTTGFDGSTIFTAQLRLQTPSKKEEKQEWTLIVETSNLLPKGTIRYAELRNTKTQETVVLVDNRSLRYRGPSLRYYWNKMYGLGYMVVVGTFVAGGHLVVYGGILLLGGTVSGLKAVETLIKGIFSPTGGKEKVEEENRSKEGNKVDKSERKH